jgi:hypothetical protein
MIWGMKVPMHSLLLLDVRGIKRSSGCMGKTWPLGVLCCRQHCTETSPRHKNSPNLQSCIDFGVTREHPNVGLFVESCVWLTLVKGFNHGRGSITVGTMSENHLTSVEATYVWEAPVSSKTTALLLGAPGLVVVPGVMVSFTMRASRRTFQRYGS